MKVLTETKAAMTRRSRFEQEGQNVCLELIFCIQSSIQKCRLFLWNQYNKSMITDTSTVERICRAAPSAQRN